jgi:hypothetical protein
MPKHTFTYVGDAAIARLLVHRKCPMPFHAARMRIWGAIASPLPDIPVVGVLASLWGGNPPPFADHAEADAFFQDMMGFWNTLAMLQDGSPPLELTKVGALESREALHAAAKMRVEELWDGFMHGFTGGNDAIDVPPGVSVRMHRIEETIRLFAAQRNTFAVPPGPDDAAMAAEFIRMFPVIDEAVEGDLNAIAIAAKAWRGERLRAPPRKRKAAKRTKRKPTERPTRGKTHTLH